MRVRVPPSALTSWSEVGQPGADDRVARLAGHGVCWCSPAVTGRRLERVHAAGRAARVDPLSSRCHDPRRRCRQLAEATRTRSHLKRRRPRTVRSTLDILIDGPDEPIRIFGVHPSRRFPTSTVGLPTWRRSANWGPPETDSCRRRCRTSPSEEAITAASSSALFQLAEQLPKRTPTM